MSNLMARNPTNQQKENKDSKSRKKITCLSTDQHDLKRIQDIQSHLLGCIEIGNRVKVLNDLGKDGIWEQAVKLDSKENRPLPWFGRVNSDLSTAESGPREKNNESSELKKEFIQYVTALALEGERKRIHVIRGDIDFEPSTLVEKVKKSLNDWRHSKDNEYLENIRKVNKWRADKSSSQETASGTLHEVPPPQRRQMGNHSPQSSSQPSSGQAESPPEPGIEQVEMTRAEELDREFTSALRDIIDRYQDKVVQMETKSARTPASGAVKTETREQTSISQPGMPIPSPLQRPLSRRNPSSLLSGVNHKAEYNLERDVKAHVIQLRSINHTSEEELDGLMEPVSESVDYEVYKGQFPDQVISMEMLLQREFTRSKAGTGHSNKNSQPPQGSNHDPEENGAERLEKQQDEQNKAQPETQGLQPMKQRIRYFHIPYNNMKWAQRAIVRYFDDSHEANNQNLLDLPNTEQNPLKDESEDESEDEKNVNPPEADMVLHPERWRGQEHGSGTETVVHSRHLRSLCERFSTDLKKPYSDKTQTNMVLFMPYLHWETDRNRVRMSEIIERAVDENYHQEREVLERWKGERVRERSKLTKTCLPAIKHNYPNNPGYSTPNIDSDATPRTIEDVVWRKVRADKKNSEKSKEGNEKIVETSDTSKDEFEKTLKPGSILQGVKMDHCRRLIPKKSLAQLLIDAARLFEAISTFQDRKVLEKFLFKEPPLHPRRSLDQAYFWKLKTTRKRDRDQVIFRYTQPNITHKFQLSEDYKRKGKIRSKIDRIWNWFSVKNEEVLKMSDKHYCPRCKKNVEKMEGWEWSGHGKYEDENGCRECAEQICRLSRAVMVDQLWMWILDEHTILTCFSGRYGVGKNDPSGVHPSIRLRLKDQSNPSNHVRSAFDLGLIILEECFDTFFDRTKTPDKRPQVLDMFAESIGRVTNLQTIAFRHLWDLTERTTKLYGGTTNEDVPAKTLLPLLNIIPESQLQREIRDIIDELEIMIHIVKQQEDVISMFNSRAREILEQKNRRSNNEPRQKSEKTPSPQPSPQVTAFKKRAAGLLADVALQIKELEGLKKSAESTAQNVNDPIGLKQQQASVIQAYQAIQQGEETVKQGKAIMLFTVMTIIFLPLSFMTSLFGMNAIELTGNNSTQPGPGLHQIVDFYPTTFLRQLTLMFAVSTFAVIVVLVPAFNPVIRAFIWSLLQFLFTFINVKVRFYLSRLWSRLWSWSNNWFSEPNLTDLIGKSIKYFNRKTQSMKRDVIKDRRKMALKKSVEKDALAEVKVVQPSKPSSEGA